MLDSMRAALVAVARVVPATIAQATTTIPGTTWTTLVAIAQATTAIPGTTRITLAAAVETPSSAAVGLGGSRRSCWFRIAWQESKL